MSVLVKNESASPYIFEGTAGRIRIDAGAIVLVADAEWATVITAKRGSGQLNPLWPNQASGSGVAHQFDHEQVAGVYEVKYLGIAEQGADTSANVWTIKQFGYTVLGGVTLVEEIQALSGVAWDDRASLAWT